MGRIKCRLEYIYEKNKDKLDEYFAGGICYVDIKGTWSYYVYGYDEATIEVASKVVDISS
jgi:hypothetical protein